MTDWVYDEGLDTPSNAGLCEWDDAAVRINMGGSFYSENLPPCFSTPPPRESVEPLVYDDGGFAGPVYYDAWEFDLEGWLVAATVADCDAAGEFLRDNFNIRRGFRQLVFERLSWAQRRYLTARVNGVVSVIDPPEDAKQYPVRDFIIPLVATDPRLYNADEQHIITIVTATPLPNIGRSSTPYVVRFNGPLTNPQIDGPGTAGTNRIRFQGVIPDGGWVEVDTYVDGVLTAVNDLGENAMGTNTYGDGLSDSSSSVIGPSLTGGLWTATDDGGAGDTVATYRDAW